MKKYIEKTVDKDFNQACILVFLSLYISFETLLFGSNADARFGTALQYLYLLGALFCFCGLLKRISRFQELIKLLLLLLSMIVLTAVVNLDFSGGYILQMCTMIIGCYLCARFSLDTFIKAFEKVIFLIACSSLIIYIIYLLMPQAFGLFPTLYNNSDYSYKFIVVSQFIENEFLVRNMAFFREPGVYVIFLVFALVVNLFYFTKPRRSHTLIIIISILTSLSTAGILLMSGTLFLYLISKRSWGGFIGLFLLSVVVFLVLSFGNETDFYLRTIDKLNPESSYYGSTTARTSSIVVPLNMLLYNPITGVGVSNFGDLYKTISKSIYHVEISSEGEATNTLFNLMATYGLLYGLLLIMYLKRFSSKLSKKNNALIRLIVFCLLSLALFNEDIRYTIPLFLFIFYGAKKNNISMQF